MEKEIHQVLEKHSQKFFTPFDIDFHDLWKNNAH